MKADDGNGKTQVIAPKFCFSFVEGALIKAIKKVSYFTKLNFFF
jgi:hypothetical protein